MLYPPPHGCHPPPPVINQVKTKVNPPMEMCHPHGNALPLWKVPPPYGNVPPPMESATPHPPRDGGSEVHWPLWPNISSLLNCFSSNVAGPTARLIGILRRNLTGHTLSTACHSQTTQRYGTKARQPHMRSEWEQCTPLAMKSFGPLKIPENTCMGDTSFPWKNPTKKWAAKSGVNICHKRQPENPWKFTKCLESVFVETKKEGKLTFRSFSPGTTVVLQIVQPWEIPGRVGPAAIRECYYVPCSSQSRSHEHRRECVLVHWRPCVSRVFGFGADLGTHPGNFKHTVAGTSLCHVVDARNL